MSGSEVEIPFGADGMESAIVDLMPNATGPPQEHYLTQHHASHQRSSPGTYSTNQGGDFPSRSNSAGNRDMRRPRGVMSSAMLSCPVCDKQQELFFCPSCIRSGDLYLSQSSKLAEKFSEKKFKYWSLAEERNKLFNDIDSLLQPRTQLESLKYSVEQTVASIEKIKAEIVIKQEKLEKQNHQRTKISNNMDQSRMRSEKLLAKINDTQRVIKHRQDAVNSRKEKRNNVIGYRRTKIEQRIREMELIFPIEQFARDDDYDKDYLGNVESTPLLTLGAGRQGKSGGSGNRMSDTLMPHDTSTGPQEQYSIVSPWLPADGDYSKYKIWASQKNFGTLDTEPNEMHKSAIRISAALAYTAQLVTTLAMLLDLRLPHRVFYLDFSRVELNEAHFTTKVAKLNANIVYLCITQKIPPSVIEHSKHTIRNCTLLMNPHVATLGSVGLIESNIAVKNECERFERELTEDLTACLESSMEHFADLYNEGATHHNEEHDLDLGPEWESVPNSPHDTMDMSTPSNVGLLSTLRDSFMRFGNMSTN